MKIIITGSLGNISKPLTKELVKKGHSVTVVSSKSEKQKDIEALGAEAAIGTVENVSFLTNIFTDADAVYCMLPTEKRYDPNFDIMVHADKVANNYVQAVQQSGVKHVVFLSSIGAHTYKGNGILVLNYNAENKFKKLPADVAIMFIRPVSLYYNMLNFVNGIKTQGVIASNYGADDMIPWVSPIDVAVAEEIVTPFTGRKMRYAASEEITCNEVASILGAAIGKPDLKWIVIPDEQLLSELKASGVNTSFAEGHVETHAAMHNGTLFEDYYRNKPTLGKVKVKDFAKDFAAVFNHR